MREKCSLSKRGEESRAKKESNQFQGLRYYWKRYAIHCNMNSRFIDQEQFGKS